MENKEAIKALIKLQSEIPKLKLNKSVSVGNKFNFQYADLPSIHEVIKPLANANGFAISYQISEKSLSAFLLHESGESISSSILFSPSSDPKITGSTITYYKRYLISALLGIDADEDKDAPQAEKVKPELSKQAFDKACERISNGETGVLNKCLAYFTLSDQQNQTLLDLEIQYG